MDGYQGIVYTWRQLTELVAAAIGEYVTFTGVRYVDADGVTFDPARNNSDCFRLAVARRVALNPCDSVFMATPIDRPELAIREYYADHRGDPMKAARVAICRAVVLQYQLSLDV